MSEISFNKRDDLKLFIKNNKHVIVRVSASWCGPRKKILPFVTEQIKNIPNNIKIVYVDFDTHRDVASALKIKSLPTFLFFFNGYPDVCLAGGDINKVASFFNKVVAKVSI